MTTSTFCTTRTKSARLPPAENRAAYDRHEGRWRAVRAGERLGTAQLLWPARCADNFDHDARSFPPGRLVADTQ